MKFFSFILAIYFIGMTAIPCCDESDCSEGRKNVTMSIQKGGTHDTQHANEMCSPLCVCNCCCGIALVSNSEINFISQIPSDNLSVCTNISLPEISFSIWQPPKV